MEMGLLAQTRGRDGQNTLSALRVLCDTFQAKGSELNGVLAEDD